MANSNFTINCKVCDQELTVSDYAKRRLYCSKTCWSKDRFREGIRKTSVCLTCKKDFLHYGEKMFCSRECNATYISQTQLGINNPALSDDVKVKKCQTCEKEFKTSSQDRVYCSLYCSHNIALEGNVVTANDFVDRNQSECQLCGSNNSNSYIHHIDHDESNLDESNLINLCHKCHQSTIVDRTFWEIVLSGMISRSKLVRKDWGGEIHIVNHNEYCLKYLFFFEDKQFSHHFHELKKELWHCVCGEFECVLEKDGKKDYLLFKQGDKIEIEPGVIHQLQAKKNSILIEVSTRHYDEDSSRVLKGVNK